MFFYCFHSYILPTSSYSFLLTAYRPKPSLLLSYSSLLLTYLLHSLLNHCYFFLLLSTLSYLLHIHLTHLYSFPTPLYSFLLTSHTPKPFLLLPTPLYSFPMQSNASVSVCHSRQKDLTDFVSCCCIFHYSMATLSDPSVIQLEL